MNDKDEVIPGNIVSQIKDYLKSEGISYWFDEEGIYSGQNFIEKIVTNLERSKVFLFVSTANSNQSKWTCKEIGCADEMGKHIIPVRIDKSPYNKQVMFRIADLDFIQFYVNPEKGLEDMADAIRNALKDIEDEKRRKVEEEEHKRQEEARRKEEERKKREEEERQHIEAQKKAIAEIRSTCVKLNGDEAKINIDREGLIMRLDAVEDEEAREKLRIFIISSSPFQKKLDEQIETIKKQNIDLEQVLSTAKSALEAREKETAQQKADFELKIKEREQEKLKSDIKMQEALDKIKGLKTEIGSLTAENKTLSEQNAQLLNQQEKLKCDVKETEKYAAEKEKEIENLNNRIKVLGKKFSSSPTLSKTTDNKPSEYTDPLDSQIEVFKESTSIGYRYGYKNKKTGKIINSAEWVSAYDFSCGRACVQNSLGDWGYIDTSGYLCIPCKWKKANSFSEDFAAVSDFYGKWGYINKAGVLVIGQKYNEAAPFVNGKAVVYLNGKGNITINKFGFPC